MTRALAAIVCTLLIAGLAGGMILSAVGPGETRVVTYSPTSGLARPLSVASPGDPRTLQHGMVLQPAITKSGNVTIASVAVGTTPEGVAFDSSNGYVYVSNSASNNVTVINGATNGVVTSIPVGTNPQGLAVDSANGYVYVTNQNSNNVTVIDGATNRVVGSIPVGVNPNGVAFDNANGYLYVTDANFTNTENSNLTVVNGATDRVVGTVLVGDAPMGIAFDSSNGYLYVVNDGSSNVTVVNGATDRVVAWISVATQPFYVGFDSTNGDLYVTSTWDSDVTVIDGTTDQVVGSVPAIGYLPQGIAFDSVNGYVYVASNDPGDLTVIDGSSNTVVAWIATSSIPQSLAFDSANGDLYVTNFVSNDVSVLNGTFHYPTVSSFVANPSTLSTGTASLLSVNVAGGVSPLGYVYTGLPPGCTSSNSPSISCTPIQGGKFVVRVFVNDSIGSSVNATTTLTANAVPSVVLTANPSPTDALAPATFRASVSGGTGPFSYTWLFGDGTRGTGQNVSHAFNSAGNYTVRAYANDTSGLVATNTIPVTVYPELSVTLSASSPTPLLGETLAFAAKASGGAGPYSYNYLGFPPGCVSENTSEIGCLPTQADFYNVTVWVTDQNGISASATVGIRVIFDFNVVVPSTVTVGNSFTITVDTNESFSGGTAAAQPELGFGALTYNYSGLPTGCVGKDAPSISCTTNQTGTYTITVSVHDQAGDANAHTVVVQVVPAQHFGLFGLPTNEGYLLLGVIVVAALAVGVAAVRFRSSGLQPPSAETGKSDLFREFTRPAEDSDDGPVKTLEPGETDPAEDIL